MRKHDVFISYSHQDEARAQDLSTRLAEVQVKVWMDDDLEGGEDWQERIVKAIRSSKVVMLLASKTSFASPEVKQELRVAKLTTTAVLPVYLEDVALPDHLLYQLAGVQRIEFYKAEAGEPFQRVLRALVSFGCQCSLKPTTRELEEPPRGLLSYGDQRLFLFGRDILGFGKGKKKSIPSVDLTLRLMPLDKAEHPENYRDTGRLSAHHGNFSFIGGQLVLHDLSTNGIFFERDEIDQEDSQTFHDFTEIVGATTDLNQERKPMNAVVVLNSRRILWLARDVLRLEACPILRRGEGAVGLYLKRLNNRSEHSYLQLASEVTWGTAADANVKMTGPAESEFMVGIERGVKHFNLRAISGDVRYAGRPLAQGQRAMLEDGASLTVGGTAVEFSTAKDDDFDSD